MRSIALLALCSVILLTCLILHSVPFQTMHSRWLKSEIIAQCLAPFMCVAIQKSFHWDFFVVCHPGVFVETLLVVHSSLSTCQHRSTAHFTTTMGESTLLGDQASEVIDFSTILFLKAFVANAARVLTEKRKEEEEEEERVKRQQAQKRKKRRRKKRLRNAGCFLFGVFVLLEYFAILGSSADTCSCVSRGGF